MTKIECSQSEYDKICMILDSMDFEAHEFAPTPEEIESFNPDDKVMYCLFLIWIAESGYETDENHDSRKYLESYLRSNITIN